MHLLGRKVLIFYISVRHSQEVNLRDVHLAEESFNDYTTCMIAAHVTKTIAMTMTVQHTRRVPNNASSGGVEPVVHFH